MVMDTGNGMLLPKPSPFPNSQFICKGSGLYQIHLVRAETIRPFIPKELKLVETLGYTVGGFYLGNYEDSRFGAFDELVVIAGTVRSGGSSPCAWNAKVLVSNDKVRDHALKELGVLSQLAKFSKKRKAIGVGRQKRKAGKEWFLNINSKWPKNYNHFHITEIHDNTNSSNITIKTSAASDADLNRFFISPQIKLSLPCLSGLTQHTPHQHFQYNCQMETRVRVVGAAKINGDKELSSSSGGAGAHNDDDDDDMQQNIMSRIVLQSKPFLTFEFNSLKLIVDSPTLLFQP